MKEKIGYLLHQELSYIYCDSCANRDKEGSRCEDCYRKHMHWALSEKCADEIAEKIMKEIGV